MKSLPSSLLIAAAIVWRVTAVIPSDSINFSPSIIATDLDDLSLGPNQSPQTRPKQTNLHILHSNIDRDPIDLDGENDIDLHSDVLDDMQDQSRHQWKSPLEQLYPIHSTSKLCDTANIIPESLPIIIDDGPRHTHKIRHAQTLQLQNNLQLKARKTGTTITALLACNSTVLILAADTRATDDTTVADSRCEKLHQLAGNVWCAGAGTSGDVEAIVRSVKYMFWKRRMIEEIGNMDRNAMPSIVSENEEDVPVASVPAILHCLRTQLQKTRGQLGVNLLVGGYDHLSRRATLAAIHPHGSMDIVTYGALGSGGLAATGVLESRYPRIGSGKCTLEEGIRLAVDAVRAGVDNDLGSGSQVDVCIIAKEGVLYQRAVVKEESLEWVKRREMDGIVKVDRTNDGGGVNGFGNVPFAIQSERVVVSGEVSTKKAKRRWLDTVLRSSKQ